MRQILCSLFGRRRVPDANWQADQRAALLRNARTAIRLGFFDEAQAMLIRVDHRATARDPEYLNLLGVLHEGRRNWKLARKCYGRAIRADRRYEPAQQNMRRFYELSVFGRCAEAVALGDERPGLAKLLQQASDSSRASPILS